MLPPMGDGCWNSRCRAGREATVTGWPGEGWKKCPGPSRRKPSQLPRVRFLPQLTSAAASAAPGCPGCLKLAGPGIILEGLWGQAWTAEQDSSPSRTPAPKALLNTPASRTAQLECRHESARWGSVPGYKQRGAPGRNPLLGDITAHPLVTTEPVTWGLEDIRTHHSRTFQQATLAHDARPGITAAPAHASGVTTMPQAAPSPHLLPWARHWCFLPGTEASAISSQGPVRSLWPGQTSPGTYGTRVHWVTARASLGGCRTKSRGSPHSPALLASPRGSPDLSHGESQAALVLVSCIFSHLSPLARGHKGDPLCSAPTRPPPGTTTHLGSRRQADKPEGLRGGKEALWGWGWFSTEQWRGRGTSQHSPVPVGEVSRGWGQALPSTARREGDRRWHLLKQERFRLETGHQNQNPCEDHEALERVAQRGCGIPEPDPSLQDPSGHNPERNCHKPTKGCSLNSRKRTLCQWEM